MPREGKDVFLRRCEQGLGVFVWVTVRRKFCRQVHACVHDRGLCVGCAHVYLCVGAGEQVCKGN